MTKSTETEIAVLQNQMTTVQTDVTEIKSDIKVILKNQEETAILQGEVDVLRKDVEDLKKKRTIQAILIPIFCSILASVMTFLIISFINSHAPASTTKITTSQVIK